MNIFNKDFTEESVEEYYKNSIAKYLERRKQYKGNNLKYCVRFPRDLLSSDDCMEAFIDSVNMMSAYGLKPSDIVYAYDNNYMKKTFSKKELYNLKKLTDIAKSAGVKVGIFDYKDVFEYEAVANADKRIKDVANKIKKHDYSPLEKLLHAYLIVSDHMYKFEDETETESQSRSIYGVLNSDKIVCAGYSEYLKAIIKEIGDENLKVFSNVLGSKTINHAKTNIGLHQNNIAYINDEKYGIDGFYYLDPTWDYRKKNALKYFMTEIGQIKNLGNEMVDSEDTKKFIINKWRKEKKDFNYNPNNPPKSKVKNSHNSKFKDYASVSACKATLDSEYALYPESEQNDELLSKFLANRQDFKDYVAKKETMHGFKNSKLSFDELLEKNMEEANKDISQTTTFHKSREIFKYLKQHSPHVDIGPVNNALHKVFGSIYPKKSKDDISKMVYKTLKQNIKDAKEWYYEEGTLWTECEDLK